MVLARTWVAHAVGMAPTERFKLRRQMAAAPGKKSTTFLSLSMKPLAWKWRRNFLPWPTQCWTEGVWTRKWYREQKAWMRQIQEVQTWKQVRGPAGAVMCETRDLGIKRPRWHTLMVSDEIKLDMRFVCREDVKEMLVQRARSVYWKKWAAKH